MNIFKALFSKPQDNKEVEIPYKALKSGEFPEKLLPYKDQILSTNRKFIKITAKPTKEELSFTTSKFNGKPYLLDADKYPTTPEGKKLTFLAQINFAETPALEGFPTSGLLQFFINDDDLMGLESKAGVGTQHRVIYFPVEQVDESKAIKDFEWVVPEYTPFSDNNSIMKLKFELAQATVSAHDFRFDELIGADFYDIDENAAEWYYEYANAEKHKLGGYIFTTQEDPRRYPREMKKYDTLLFQMVSQFNGNKYDICWGDVGVGHFFINSEKLKNLDFSDTFYSWDCS